jgi:hypothetical protein
MNSKYLMISSAIILGFIGIILSFMPDEIIRLLNSNQDKIVIVICQITGALYIGFASLNWMARGNIIGGIYSKPLALGNFVHFFVGGMALIKFVSSSRSLVILFVVSVIYIIFAIWFGLLLFRHPAGKE